MENNENCCTHVDGAHATHDHANNCGQYGNVYVRQRQNKVTKKRESITQIKDKWTRTLSFLFCSFCAFFSANRCCRMASLSASLFLFSFCRAAASFARCFSRFLRRFSCALATRLSKLSSTPSGQGTEPPFMGRSQDCCSLSLTKGMRNCPEWENRIPSFGVLEILTCHVGSWGIMGLGLGLRQPRNTTQHNTKQNKTLSRSYSLYQTSPKQPTPVSSVCTCRQRTCAAGVTLN